MADKRPLPKFSKSSLDDLGDFLFNEQKKRNREFAKNIFAPRGGDSDGAGLSSRLRQKYPQIAAIADQLREAIDRLKRDYEYNDLPEW